MILDREQLTERAKRIYDQLHKFTDEFLKITTIKNQELVEEHPCERGYASIAYKLHPMKDGERTLWFEYTDDIPPYVTVAYLIDFKTECETLEKFKEKCGLLKNHGKEISDIVNALPEDIDEIKCYYEYGKVIVKPRPDNSYYSFSLAIYLYIATSVFKSQAKAIGMIEKIVSKYYRTNLE